MDSDCSAWSVRQDVRGGIEPLSSDHALQITANDKAFLVISAEAVIQTNVMEIFENSSWSCAHGIDTVLAEIFLLGAPAS
jgi:hypothetical protein